MANAALKGFSFDGQLAGCDFNLTLNPYAPSLLFFRLILTSAVVEDRIERRFSCGCTLVRTATLGVDASTDLVLARTETLTPTPLDAGCLALLTDALRDWFAKALAPPLEKPG